MPNDKHGALRAIAQAIQNTVTSQRIKSGRVSVVETIDDEDMPLSVRIANIPEHFGEQDYDELATKINLLNTASFHNHVVVSELIKICSEKYEAIFMIKERGS